MPKRLLRCQSAAVRYLDFEQISLIHSPFRRAFTIISMNFILAFNTQAKLKTRQLPSNVVHRTRTFPKRKNAVERTDERAAIFVLNARLFIHQPYACAVVIQLCRAGVVQLAFYNCCLKEVCRRTSLSPMKVQV